MSLSTRPRKRCLRKRCKINLEVGTGSIVLSESRWLVIIYSFHVQNVFLFAKQSPKTWNNFLGYSQLQRDLKLVAASKHLRRVGVLEEQLIVSVITFSSHNLFISRAKQLKYSKTMCYWDHVFVNNCLNVNSDRKSMTKYCV